MYFFIRNDEAFMPLGFYCHKDSIYEYFDEYTSEEKIRPITTRLLEKIYDNVIEEISFCKDRIYRAEEMRSWIGTFNNSIDEKMDMLENVGEVLADCDKEFDRLIQVREYVCFLNNILETIDDSSHIEANKYLYCGIDIPSPTVDDIVR